MTIRVGRLNFWVCESDKESRALMEAVRDELKDRKIKQYRIGEEPTCNWRLGNYCLPGVPIDVAEEMTVKYGLHIDNIRNILDREDIENVNVGDRVTVELCSDFGYFRSKGTVIKKDNAEIVVKKYRSRTKGWYIRVGDEGSISLGW